MHSGRKAPPADGASCVIGCVETRHIASAAEGKTAAAQDRAPIGIDKPRNSQCKERNKRFRVVHHNLARFGAAVNDFQQAALYGFFLFVIALVANGTMVAFGVAAPILGHAEEDLIVRIKELIAGLFH